MTKTIWDKYTFLFLFIFLIITVSFAVAIGLGSVVLYEDWKAQGGCSNYTSTDCKKEKCLYDLIDSRSIREKYIACLMIREYEDVIK